MFGVDVGQGSGGVASGHLFNLGGDMVQLGSSVAQMWFRQLWPQCLWLRDGSGVVQLWLCWVWPDGMLFSFGSVVE